MEFCSWEELEGMVPIVPILKAMALVENSAEEEEVLESKTD